MFFDFSKQLEIGERYEALLAKSLRLGGYKVKPVRELAFQKMGVDAYIHGPTTGILTVQFKADERAGDTGNAFIETHIKSGEGEELARGWAWTTMALVIAYYIPTYEHIWMIDTMKLRRALPFWSRRWPISNPVTTRRNGSEWSARGLLVPLDSLERQVCTEVLSVRTGKPVTIA